MNDYACVRCGCLYHAAWTPQGEPIPCAHGCADYRPAFAWTRQALEAALVKEAVTALRKGKDPAVVLRMLAA